MMRRAGRPQYDKSGTVIVMCERSKVNKFRNMLNASTLLESCLHENLTEHINSEIALGTIRNLQSAQEWLKSSFLYVRIQQNPKHYALVAGRDKPQNKSWDEWLDHYVEVALSKLKCHKLVTHSTETSQEEEAKENLQVTEAGKIMSSHCISLGTMCSILSIDGRHDFESLFEILCGAREFSDIRIRPGELQMLNSIRNSGGLRFKLDNSPKTYADKVFILLQASFGNIDVASQMHKLETGSIALTLGSIYQSAGRIAKAIVQICAEKELGRTLRAALELMHCVYGRAWEDDYTVLRQLLRIGPKSMKTLEANGIRSFDDLLAVEPKDIAIWLSRKLEFGIETQQRARDLPRYQVEMKEMSVETHEDRLPKVYLQATVKQISGESREAKRRREKLKQGNFLTLSILFLRSDGEFVDFRRLP
ncbi:Sec63 Brl domain-domain-containing protein [Kockovaella imperatae]|uniref:DNA 3'-5' helicase n=1 Tax=Kockovaella imperatae TaxID=4999 RepID=A0A1Y1UC75_9TREE|nr:Sec63 Brl domain-domain-containing protein [Kockovaella imperatae]ORX35643.1 Sec63 Brl domain-domain-containing protein [Kockovaella imperatae]